MTGSSAPAARTSGDQLRPAIDALRARITHLPLADSDTQELLDGLARLARQAERIAFSADRTRREKDIHYRLLTKTTEDLRTALAETEERVRQRTRSLEQRSIQLATAAEVAASITALRDPQDLLPYVAAMLAERFGLYCVGIYLADPSGRLRAAAIVGADGRALPVSAFDEALEGADASTAGWVAARRTRRVVPDVRADASHRPHALVPETRAQMALPLLSGDALLGVLDVQSRTVNAFDANDVRTLESVANQVSTALENARLFQAVQADDARKRQELERASAIQHRLLPTSIRGWPGALEIAFRFRAAAETSGDFYDVVEAAPTTPENRAPLQIAVADVAGKGMGAALVMSLARAGLRYGAALPSALSPAGTARLVGDRLQRDVGAAGFVACALATVEPLAQRTSAARLRLVNAGQVPVLLCRGGGVTELEPPGDRLPLGATSGASYRELSVDLVSDDVVIFSSDGLPEAPHASTGEFFGFDRLAASAAAWSACGESAEKVATGIWSDLSGWCGEESHHDDMTLLVLRVGGGSKRGDCERG